MKRFVLSLALLSAAVGVVALAPPPDLAKTGRGFREHERNGWIYVRLEGAPEAIGFQHGSLLRPEIEDAYAVIRLDLTHDGPHGWDYFRTAAERDFWPHVEEQYRKELQGLAEGLRSQGSHLDLWDVVAANAWLELSPYYEAWRDHTPQKAPPEHCSAFVATGSYTRDHRIVIGHNNWSSYLDGSRWRIIFDIRPSSGYRVLMDGMPGLIHSGDDFGINSVGLAITETTITRFTGFDGNGIPEFVRARKAMQYASSIDDFDRIMRDGNNGGYANNWLVADNKTGEIASLELGLKNVILLRTKDGYFAGANFPVNPKLIREETTFDPDDKSASAAARHIRADQLIARYKGRIDLAFGRKYLSDHYDSFDRKVQPGERTLCGHIDLSARGSMPWQPPFGASGTVQAKVADSRLVSRMSFSAAMGHPCGIRFNAVNHIREHPSDSWQQDLLRDIPSRPWTTFSASR